MNTPISINDVDGNVTVTIIDGNNNKTDIRIEDFENQFPQECGFTFLYNDPFKKDSDTSTNFNDWLKGFQFNIKSIYYEKEYRREELLNKIKTKLDKDNRLLLLGESGTSKSTLLMEVLCDYLRKGYKILHNLDPVSIGNSSGEIKNIQYIENTLLKVVETGKNVLVVVDNVHNKTISDIFSVMKRIRDNYEDKFKKITFLLSARQPDFDLAMTGGGIFDSETKDRIDLLFDNTKREPIPYFSQEEVKGFIEKYREYLDSSLRNKSIDENFQVIFNDTKGHSIMVRFSVLKNGLRNHVRQMYDQYLTMDHSPNIERIKSVIACSLYHISSIPLNDKTLSIDLDLEDPSYELDKTIIKIDGDIWTTIHPRWDLELFNYLFSLNSAHIRKIQRAFSIILNKILEVQFKSYNQLLILNTIYNTIAVEHFIDIKLIQEMIKEDDIEKKLDDLFKVLFFANSVGVAFGKLKNYENAIVYYDKAIDIKPHHRDKYINIAYVSAYTNKGIALSELGKKEEAIACYEKAIRTEPQYADAYYSKGVTLSDLGRNKRSIKYYDQAIKIEPQYALAYYGKANMLSALGRYEDAIACYDKAIEINPQYVNAYTNKGNALSDLSRNKEALACYDQAIKIEPQYTMAYLNKGKTLFDLGRKEEAIIYFDKALEKDPQFADAYFNKGIVLSELDRNEEAIACYDKAIEINPQYAMAYTNKGIALLALGKNEEVIASFDQAIEINPQYAKAYYNKGAVLSHLGRYEEAITSYDKAIEIDPHYTFAYDGKANAVSALGKKEEQ